jgi:non-canonical poly(A) RNA polymerase PAPD5/7
MDPRPSVGAVNGLDAVAWIKRQCETFPALRPLVLTLKRLLKTHALDDASTGGCGGYLLVSLAVSHLRLSGDAGKASPGNLGALLLGFLRRFGNDFDYARTAVAAGRASGVLSAKELVVHPGAFGRRPVILCEDPQARLLRVFASPQFFLPQPKINSRPGPERRRSARLCDDVAMI